MSIEEKEAKIIDLNLFSGSADAFRTAVGGYFEVVDVETTEDTTITTGQETQFNDYSTLDVKSPFIYTMAKDQWSPTGQAQPISDNIIIPNMRYAVRAYASLENWKNDIFWKTYWVGGSYGGETYPGLYNETVRADYWFEFAFPYSQMEANFLADKENVLSIATISSEYNHYLPEYQEYVKNLDSELLIPNMYTIEMFNGTDIANAEDPEGLMSETASDIESRLFDKTIEDFVSLQGLYDTSGDDSELGPIGGSTLGEGLLGDKDVIYLAAPAEAATDTSVATSEGLPNYNLHGYLSQSVPLTSLSSSTTAYIKNAFQNIFFDQYSIAGGTTNHTFTNMENNKSLFPYYVNISFPSRNQQALQTRDEDITDPDFVLAAEDGIASDQGWPSVFVESIADRNFSPKFLKSLKEIFNNEANTVVPRDENYAISQDYQSSSADSTIDDQVLTTETTSLRSVDYLKLLNYSYQNYKSTTDNCYFVGEKLINREVAMDPNGVYRYLNSKNTLEVMEDALEIINTEGGLLSVYENTNMYFSSLLNGWRGENVGKYNETIAYRVEKIGGTPTGDSQTQNVLQNFWIFNSINLVDDIKLFDSQVKYGENYTYNVYAYVICVGLKYKFSDLTLTREINYNAAAAAAPYCLEWYNAATNETSNQLAANEDDSGNAWAQPNNNDADHLSTTDYTGMADFYVNYEPHIKLFEIPIASKTLKVLDNPANQLLINPFQLLDASQTIGYTVEYERFIEQPYPKTISSANIISKQDYLNAKDLLEENNLTEAPVSRQRYLEIYRLNEKPKTFSDFDNNLVSTIDLILEDSKFTLPSAIFYDMIKTNQKYYYLFRVLNENRMAGQLSEIYEAELINDGGYTYSNFDILFEEDLEEEIFVDPTITFKKLIQLKPNISQIVFNDGAVDYTNTAASQLGVMGLGDADDLIWGKTFKIRLTSKKTGKKMDLNVTYKYETESN